LKKTAHDEAYDKGKSLISAQHLLSSLETFHLFRNEPPDVTEVVVYEE